MQARTRSATDALLQHSALPYITLAIGLLGIGFAPILARAANAPGPMIAFFRLSTGSLLLAVPLYQIAAGSMPVPKLSAGIGFAALAGAFFAGDITLWATGISMGGAVIPTLLNNTAPILVGLGAMIFFKERLRVMFWVGLGIALLGAIGVLGADMQATAELNVGALIAWLGGAFYAGYILAMQKAREHTGNMLTYVIATGVSALIVLVVVLLTRTPLTGYPWQSYAAVVGMGVISQIIGQNLIMYTLGHLPASIVSPTLLMQPVIAGVLAGPLLGEWLNGWQILASLVVLAGVYVVHHSRQARTGAAE